MEPYIVTKAAGDIVAGFHNPGAGETLYLKPSQAEHPLRLGYIQKPASQPRSVKPRRRSQK